MQTLTATQKLELYQLHSRYMTNDCEPSGPCDPDDVGNLRSEFTKYYESLALTLREAEILSWEVCRNYATIFMAAIREGYTNEYLTPAGIAEIARDAAREARGAA